MKRGSWLLRMLKPYWRWIVLAPILMFLEVTMDLMQPRMVQRIVDVGIANLDLRVVLTTGAIMLGLALVGAFGGMTNGICAEMTIQGFGRDLRERLFRKVQTFSFANLDALDTGQLITRLTNDVTQLQEAIYMTLRMLVRAPLLLIGSLIFAIVTSPQLAFLPLALMPVELVFVLWIVRRATPLFGLVQTRLDDINGVMQENLAGVRVVKAFVRARHELARFGTANAALADTSIRAGRIAAVVPAFMMLTVNLGVIGVLWFGGVNVVAGRMHVGQIIAFVNYLMITLNSLMMVSQLVIMLSRASASAGRIRAVLDTEPAIANAPGAQPAPALRGEVVFEDVSFAYPGAESEAVLRGVSFSAAPGQVVAILGTTGAGKSSLVHLIPRYYDPTGGRVLVDGLDVRSLQQDTLRCQIGTALQETVLFSGTIRDNIRYGRPDASDEQVEAAAQVAQAHAFISGFPEGYDTLVGQRGVNLSGGQKQRIAIARAVLLQPAILILDDSTSAVDVDTEAHIQAALQGVMRGRTSFVIAQRISTVLTADKILVLDQGRIAAQGTHGELMAASAIYRDIYRSQLGEEVLL